MSSIIENQNIINTSEDFKIYTQKNLPTDEVDRGNLQNIVRAMIQSEKIGNILKKNNKIPHDPENFEVIPFIKCTNDLKSLFQNDTNSKNIQFGIKPTENTDNKLLCKIVTERKYWGGFSQNLNSWIIIREKNTKKNIFVFDTGTNKISMGIKLEKIKKVINYFVNMYYVFKCEKIFVPYRPLFKAVIKDSPFMLSINFLDKNNGLQVNPYTEMCVLFFNNKEDKCKYKFNIGPFCSLKPLNIRNLMDTYCKSDNINNSLGEYFVKLDI